jgi:hypothetical protein
MGIMQGESAIYDRNSPVVPVLDSDRKEAFPNYEGVPEDVYKTDWWMSAAYLEW